MGEVVDFPERPLRRLIVAVEDDLHAVLVTTSFIADDHVVVYVPASSLADPKRDADLWIGRHTPSATGRRLFFQTTSGAVYEVDDERHVWRNGEAVFDAQLVDYGIPETRERGILRVGSCCALLFLHREGSGWHMRIRLTTPVILVGYLPPATVRHVPAGWLTLARRLPRDGGSEPAS